MRKGFGIQQGVFGWGLLTLTFAVLGAFSTILNGLQTLNGLFCFVIVPTETWIRETAVSSFSVSGYGNNHYYNLDGPCADIEAFMEDEPYPFCEKRNTTGPVGNLISEGFHCSQSAKGNGNIRAYSYKLDVNCTLYINSGRTFQISLTPGSFSMAGVPGNALGFLTTAVVHVDRCSLSKHFYIFFSSICAMVTGTIFLIRASMRTYFVHFSFRLSDSVKFYWVYKTLAHYGFFDFSNPYVNEPYHLVKAEKFYVMRNQSAGLEGEVNEGPESGSQRGVEEEAVQLNVESLAWCSSKSVYKFTYDNGRVYAYSKDHCGFETFVEAKVERSVASVIKKYLKLKSQSGCITNDERSHFLSLTECCKLAKEGYKMVEEIADNNYPMYYGSPQLEETNRSVRTPEQLSRWYQKFTWSDLPGISSQQERPKGRRKELERVGSQDPMLELQSSI